MGIDKRHFGGGMNSDDEDRLLAPGDYRYALNVRAGITDGENNGSIENSKGNQLVEIGLPSGTNEVIGTYEDKNTNKVYYFLWNSTGEHGVYCFDIQEKQVYLLLKEVSSTRGLLNFNRGFLITGVSVIDDGERQLLYWTDNFNSPKKLNITTAFSGRSVDGEYGPYGLCEPEWIEVIKPAPSRAPEVEFGNDSSRKTNFLSGKSFQLKAQFVYDDDEPSAWGPISKLMFPRSATGQFSLEDNYIKATIKKPVDINTKNVSRIRIAARENNTGDFFLIYDEEYTYSSNEDMVIYRFYNDGTYSSIDLAESNKLFDDVPKKAQAQAIIDGNRIAYGNVLNGFNQVEVSTINNASFTSLASADESKGAIIGTDEGSTYTVSGYIVILNPYVLEESGSFSDSREEYFATQPVWTDTEFDDFVWGGLGPNNNDKSIAIKDLGTSPQKFDPDAEEKGFPVYLVGTEFKAKTVQKMIKVNYESDKPQNNGKDIESFGDLENKSFSLSEKGNDVNRSSLDYANIYLQYFEIENVPAGKHIVRVASSSITDAEFNTLEYQKTSTNVFRSGRANYTDAGYPSFRSEDSGTEVVIDVNGNINDVLFYVADMAKTGTISNKVNPDSSGGAVTSVAAYMRDDVDGNVSSQEDFFQLNPIQNCIITNFPNNNKFDGLRLFDQGKTANWSQGIARTDHNGYFFYTTDAEAKIKTQGSAIEGQELNAYVGKNDDPLTTSSQLFKKYDGSWTDLPKYEDNYESALMALSNVSNQARFTVRGNISNSSGNPVGNVTVIIEDGGFTVSDSNTGDWAIVIHEQGVPSSFPFDVTPTGDIIYNYYAGALVGELDASTDVYDGTGSTVPDGANSRDVQVADRIFRLRPNATSVSIGFKKGGRYHFGLVYYDQFNRSSTVMTNDNMKVDLESYNTGVNRGKPIVNWNISHKAPSWATHYQWVRTKNLAVADYVQVAVKEVLFFDAEGNDAVDRLEAVSLGFDIQSISDYNNSGRGFLNYSFSKGDRIRFIQRPSGDYFTQEDENALDFPVISYKTISDNGVTRQIITIADYNSLPDIPKGTLIELYTPKKLVEEEDVLFYEFDQWGLVKEGDHYNRDGSAVVTSGSFDNTGDTFYRLREFNTGGRYYGYFIDDPRFSDSIDIDIEDIGRPNRIDKDAVEVRRPTTIYYSEKFVPETKINGLSNFFSLSFEAYEMKYGQIQKLFAYDNDLDVYQERKVGKILVNKNVLVGLDGESTVTSGTSVLSQMVYYKGEFGIGDHPESFAEYGGRRYFVDIYRGAVLRLGGDGLTPISNYKMNNYFSRRHELLAKSKYKVNIWGAYNKDFESYFISYQGINETAIEEFVEAGNVFSEDEKEDAFDSVSKSRSIETRLVLSDTGKEEEDAFGGNIEKDTVKNRFESDLTEKISGESIVSSNKATDRERQTRVNSGALPQPSPEDQPTNLDAIKNLEGATLEALKKSNPAAAKTIDEMVKRASFNQPVTGFDSNVNLKDSGGGTYEVDATPEEPLDSPFVSYAVADEMTGQYVVVIAEEGIETPSQIPINSPIIVEGTTVAFCEATKRWTSFYSWVADGMSSMGMNICSFKEGNLYIHNRTTKYGNFYGQQNNAEIHVVFNVNPSEVKIFQALSLESDDVWIADEITTPEGQKTSIVAEDFDSEQDSIIFDNKEGVYYTALWRDENTPNVENPLFNGDMMRSKSLKVKLKNTNSDNPVKILIANVKFIKSNRSNG